jgi:hypothetical protein
MGGTSSFGGAFVRDPFRGGCLWRKVGDMMGRMNASHFSRRTFVKSGAAAAALAAMNWREASATGVSWPIGCFNRPWMQKFGQQAQPITTPQPANWGLEAALKGMREAGYAVAGLLTLMPGEPFVGAAASDVYLADLKKRIAAAGLTVTLVMPQ